jgi:hypothetical protein
VAPPHNAGAFWGPRESAHRGPRLGSLQNDSAALGSRTESALSWRANARKNFVPGATESSRCDSGVPDREWLGGRLSRDAPPRSGLDTLRERAVGILCRLSGAVESQRAKGWFRSNAVSGYERRPEQRPIRFHKRAAFARTLDNLREYGHASDIRVLEKRRLEFQGYDALKTKFVYQTGGDQAAATQWADETFWINKEYVIFTAVLFGQPDQVRRLEAVYQDIVTHRFQLDCPAKR